MVPLSEVSSRSTASSGLAVGAKNPGVATFDDRSQKRCPIPGPTLVGILTQFGVAHAGAPELDQQSMAADGGVQIAVDHRDQPIPRVDVTVGQRLQREHLELGWMPHGLDEHVLARAEVALQRADRHPAGGRDVCESGPLIAALGEHVRNRLQNRDPRRIACAAAAAFRCHILSV